MKGFFVEQNLLSTAELESPVVASIVAKSLRRHGWTIADSNVPAFALKSFKTAVGNRVASIFFSVGKFNYSFNGYYQSEGRNILEPCIWLVPKEAEALEIEQLADMFAIRVDEAVVNSYAARLLEKRINWLGNAEPF